ncbi:DNA polymerase-3 subunit delta' [Luteococcus japonicus]|uniref:DNA polymerase-3 subunit delta n=1 Tax=Luteococcus japonicus TaxID=33984 RepID=A0A3N1ZV79_9ACTN|nr:DNA polymerase III subunit delta' [Luteococcus japonicus]ROR54367.1 DNA polymerase-3 subunit delta' [Luteococcus japonicus]
MTQTTPDLWSELVGQNRAVEVLKRAVAGDAHAMTHAWLVTGPPGSGRSNAARAFAAALQCPRGGCGQCNECRTSLSGAHPDVTLVRTEMLSIGVDEVRDLVRRAAMSPTMGRHQVIVVEDADRVTDRGGDALLKAIEEPAPKTVWILCAPTADDVVVTIRSRCRRLSLSTPSDAAVAELLQWRDGVDPALAAHAARAAQGHIGRARALARNEEARNRRHEVLMIPGRLSSVGACLTAADNLVKAAAEEATKATAETDSAERAKLEEALGFGTKGARPRNANAALKELEEQQKARAKRIQRDALDRVLTELTTFYRDVLALQTGAISAPMPAQALHSGVPADGGPHLINGEIRNQLERASRGSTPEQTLRRIDAIIQCREALETNVAPLLAMEALLLSVAD